MAKPKFLNIMQLPEEQQRAVVQGYVNTYVKPYVALVELANANRGNRSERLGNWIESVEAAPLSFNITALHEADDKDAWFVFDFNSCEDETEIKSALLFVDTVKDILTDRLNTLALQSLGSNINAEELEKLPEMQDDLMGYWKGLLQYVESGQIERRIFVEELGDFLKKGNRGRGVDIDQLNVPTLPKARVSGKSKNLRLFINGEMVTTVTINGKEQKANLLSQAVFGALGITFDRFHKILDGRYDPEMEEIDMPAPKLQPDDWTPSKEDEEFTVKVKLRKV